MRRRKACGGLAVVLAALAVGCNDATEGPNPQGTGSASKGQSVQFIGFDANPKLIDALKQGKLEGLVLQNPYNMGDLGVRALVDHLEKVEVKASMGTGEKMATPETLGDPEIEQLLNPPKAEVSASGSAKPGPKTKKWRILVIPKATSNEYWQTVHAGARKVAEEFDVELIWDGPQKEDDYTKQIQLVEGAKAMGVDGIVLAPLDSKVLVSPVEKAIDNGIPVIIIDSGLESTKPVSFIATDNYHGGVLAGKRMAELLGGKGEVVLLRHMVGSESTEQREKGFLETLARYPGIQVLSKDEYAGPTVDSAAKAAQDLLTRFRDQLDGIFCSNEQSTSGMLQALEGAGMLKASQEPAEVPQPASQGQ
ncbi:MAG TPA: substrate-binding domain-containing protein [Isosphaeraceae bacterium]